MRKLLITIDGPAGAGKTTVSRALAERLGYRYIDTGALYRGVALVAHRQGVRPEDDAALERMLAGLKLTLRSANAGLRLIANGEDITDLVRTPEVSMLASRVSARPAVRAYLLQIQRELGREKAAVFEGRDMGTVVFPEAEVKFFLSASEEIRARRRFCDPQAQPGPSLEEVERDLRRRDEQDSRRVLAPLKAAADAVAIDSSALSVAEVVERMVSQVQKLLGLGSSA